MVLMKVRFASDQEIKKWNDLIIANPDGGNAFSSYEFAMQKETGGYNARFVMVGNLAVTVLEKRFPFLGSLWYLPKGPNIKNLKELWPVLKSLESFAKENGAFAIRIESELTRDIQPSLEKKGLKKVRPIIPNPSTITLDISDDLEKVITKMPQKGRYAIKRAERDGVKVNQVKSSDKNCKIMYDLLSETADGQFGIRSFNYYKTYWQRFEKAGHGQMLFAYYDEQVVAGAYAMIYGKKSTYKDGASIRKRTAYGASHYLQWQVIQWAKKQGANIHDLCGSPPSDQVSNKNHPHYGIGLFKTSFNKEITDYIGCYDYIIDNLRYSIWIKFAEKVAQRIHYYRYHDSYF